MTSEKKVNEKVLFLIPFNNDWMGNAEEINYDSKGYFMFDFSSMPPRPLIKGIPIS